MSLLNSVLKVFVGDKTKKDLSKILPIVDQINKHFVSYKDISNDDLREKTQSFKKHSQRPTQGSKQANCSAEKRT